MYIAYCYPRFYFFFIMIQVITNFAIIIFFGFLLTTIIPLFYFRHLRKRFRLNSIYLNNKLFCACLDWLSNAEAALFLKGSGLAHK